MRVTIIDASVFIKYGSKMHGTKNNEVLGVPTGGLEQLLNMVALKFKEGSKPIICFDSPTKRTSTYEGYKGNRPPDAKSYIQSKLAYKILSEAGFTCFKEDGYEADDLIVKCVKDNREIGRKIYVLTNDMDMAQVVDKDVSIICPTSLSTDVNMNNYSSVVVRGSSIPYNSILIYKLLFGDKSDNMKKMVFSDRSIEPGLVFKSMLDFGVELVGSKLNLLVSPAIPARWIEQAKFLNDEDVKELHRRMLIFYPKKCDKDLAFQNKPIVKDTLKYYTSMFKFYRASNLFSVVTETPTEEMNNFLYQVKFEYVEYVERIEKGLPMHKKETEEITNIGSF